MSSPKITPFLWYDNNQAEEAATYYTTLFPNSHIISKTPMVTTFSLSGQEFCALNGGPQHKFTPAISLLIRCADQAEVDHFWDAFVADGGTADRCGWVRDRYGVSWQVVPTVLAELMQDEDREKAGRAMKAMLGMGKLDIAELRRAHAGEGRGGE
ncbi:hypothetical protein MMC24_007083 [Lignoscripta atroalba]|nr:hypothetical protein [Lignoscripta atroalba]